MKKAILLLAAAAFASIFAAANSEAKLTLQRCYESAEANYPLAARKDYYDEVRRLKNKNHDANYLPAIDLIGKAQYQSEVTKIDLDFDIPVPGFQAPEIPTPPLDQYSIGLQISQLVWDGGVSNAMKNVEEIKAKLESANADAEIAKVKQNLTEVFFNALIVQENIAILEVALEDLAAKTAQLRSAVENGVALESSLDILKAESLKLEQKIDEARSGKTAAIEVLARLAKIEISPDEELAPPENLAVGEIDERARPEFEAFEYTYENLSRSQDLVSASYMPKISAFASAAYARPGLNMFETGFNPYFIVGVQAKWNIFSWGKHKREKQILVVQKEIVQSGEEAFALRIEAASREYVNQIARLEDAIEKDEEIIALREKIVDETASRMTAGIITATEYVSEQNAKTLAEIESAVRKIQLLKAKSQYLALYGNYDKIK